MQEEFLKPEFLITPYQIYSDVRLRQSDKNVFAVLYWFDKMKDGKCTASNETIARIVKIEIRTVERSLENLEKYGYIQRNYEDKEKRNRKYIKTLISLKTTTVQESGRDRPAGPKRPSRRTGDIYINNNIINKERQETISKRIPIEEVVYAFGKMCEFGFVTSDDDDALVKWLKELYDDYKEIDWKSISNQWFDHWTFKKQEQPKKKYNVKASFRKFLQNSREWGTNKKASNEI